MTTRSTDARRRLRILTWHVHGSYLFYLTQGDRHDYFLPVRPDRGPGYGGRGGNFPWGDNVHEVPADEVHTLELDAVLYQSRANYLEDQHRLLSDEQQMLPRIYLEHDPPREHPTDTRHPASEDAGTLLVHVTHFNDLMWDNGVAPTRVIPHGVVVPAHARYSGEIERGLCVVNHLPLRGRRLGLDVFERVRREVPLDLVGMESEALGGLGDIPLGELHALAPQYRFLFNPIRYTSMGLAVCEAMMLGMPVVGLATTEMSVAIENGRSGYVDTNVGRLIGHMQRLLADPDEARRLGEGARARASALFGIERFLDDWDAAWEAAASLRPQPAAAATETLLAMKGDLA